MNNSIHWVWLIPVFPLLGFLINGLCRNYLSRSAAGLVGSGAVLASFGLSLMVFNEVRSGGHAVLRAFTFLKTEDFTIDFAFQTDALSALFLLIITGIGFLIHLYSTSYMHEEKPADFARYFAYLNLFVFSMLLLVMGANLVVMFIGWEGVGLCSYLLIGYWFRNTDYTDAAKKAFIMNRIGDLGFLLAVFWLLHRTGTVSFDQLFTPASLARLRSGDITAITLLLFLGATGKSAQIPLYTWLPDAMAGPTPVSALIHAATMVTAGIYMIARSADLFRLAHVTNDVITLIGMATAFLAATIALRQNDIKKVLAYSTVSQLGFMFLALGTGNYTAAVFHVLTHAFFKALMFLGSGSVIHAMGGEQDIRNMGGLQKKMRITGITFLIGCLAISGVPGLSGFFSKDAILAGAYAHAPLLYGMALFTALLTAFYMFRLYFVVFTGRFRGTRDQEDHLHESPWAMTLPLLLLALLSVVGGYVGVPHVLGGHDQLSAYLSPVVKSVTHAIPHQTEYLLMGLSVGLVLTTILYAWFRFRDFRPAPTSSAWQRLLENKWYVDEVYDALVVRPLRRISRFFQQMVETRGIDGLVNGVGRAVNYGSRQLRWLQSGQVGAYVLLMVIGMLVLFTIQLFL